MKRYIIPILIGSFAIFALAGCSEGAEKEVSRTILVNASFSGSETRADVEMSSGSLDLITRWKADDRIRLYVLQEGKAYDLGSVQIYDISEDGKRCSFTFRMPLDVSWDHPYDVYGLCDAEGIFQEGEPMVLAKSPLMRMPWDNRIVPMWFHAQGSGTNIQASFRHLGTYEILHVENTSQQEISFSHDGFSVETPWYKGFEYTPLKDDYDPTQFVTEPDDEVSDRVTIGAEMSGVFLSWYIPSGALINNARLEATINGKRVTSTNTKSSDVRILRGHAYHMYATWNGSSLAFIAGGSEVDAGGSAYGSDTSGNVSGSGLGYGSDESGSISSGGSGYGSDESGGLSGGGSGYSNGN